MADENLNPDSLNALIAAEGESLERDQDQADFDAAFDGEERHEASPPKGDAEEQEEEYDPEPNPEANPAGTEVEGRQEGKKETNVDPLKALEQRLTARVRNIEGRFGELNRGWNQIQQEVKGIAGRRGVETPSAKQLEAARHDSKLLAELREEYKEWSMISEAVAEEKAAQTEERILQKIPKMDGYVSREDMQQAIATATFEARQAAIVDFRHQGWEDTVATPEFRSWLMAQDENTKAFAESDLASDTIALLDLYTKSKRPADVGKKEKQQQRLKSAVSPTQGRATPRPAASTEEDDFLAAFDN